MIVPDGKDSQMTEGSVVSSERSWDSKPAFTTVTSDSPPSYTPSEAAPSTSTLPSNPPPLRPANLLSITQQNSAIRGTFLIDPTLVIPESVLPKLSCGEVRKNLYLHSHNGSVTADVIISPTPGVSRPLGPRTSVVVSSKNGAVTVKLQQVEGEATSLSTYAWNGKTHVYLPRSFAGPVSITSCNGKVVCSPDISASTTIFSEVSKSKNWFIGDPTGSGWAANPETWLGDELRIDAKNGRVNLLYVDEEDGQADEPRKLAKDRSGGPKFGFKFGQGGQWGIGFWDEKR